MKIKIILCVLSLITFSFQLVAQNVVSPDGRIKVTFFLSDSPSKVHPTVAEGTPFYEVTFENKPFLLPSRLGFDVLGTAEIKHYFRLAETLRSEKRSSWQPVYGERNEYPDNYNEMKVILEETLYPYRKLHIVFRAYNEGIAFRYELPDQPGFEKVVLDREYTEFTFPRYTSVWESYGHEGKYYKVYPYEVKPNC